MTIDSPQLVGKTWKLIKNRFSGSTMHSKLIALEKLMRLQFRETKSFIEETRQSLRLVRNAGMKMEPELISLLIPQKLPQQFESIVTVIAQEDPLPDKETVLMKIEKHKIQFLTREDQYPTISLYSNKMR